MKNTTYSNTRIEEEFNDKVVCINQTTIAIKYQSMCIKNRMDHMGRVN